MYYNNYSAIYGGGGCDKISQSFVKSYKASDFLFNVNIEVKLLNSDNDVNNITSIFDTCYIKNKLYNLKNFKKYDVNNNYKLKSIHNIYICEDDYHNSCMLVKESDLMATNGFWYIIYSLFLSPPIIFVSFEINKFERNAYNKNNKKIANEVIKA